MAKLTLGEHKFVKVTKPITQRNARFTERDVRVILTERDEKAEVTQEVYGRTAPHDSMDPWRFDNSYRQTERRAMYDANIIIGNIGVTMTLQEAINFANKLNNELGNAMQEVRA